jgi:hypothetical protein
MTNYKLVPVTLTEDEMSTMAFCCSIQDTESLEAIQEMLGDDTITAAQFITENGDYDNLHIRFGYPSFRHSVNWLKVEYTEEEPSYYLVTMGMQGGYLPNQVLPTEDTESLEAWVNDEIEAHYEQYGEEAEIVDYRQNKPIGTIALNVDNALGFVIEIELVKGRFNPNDFE